MTDHTRDATPEEVARLNGVAGELWNVFAAHKIDTVEGIGVLSAFVAATLSLIVRSTDRHNYLDTLLSAIVRTAVQNELVNGAELEKAFMNVHASKDDTKH